MRYHMKTKHAKIYAMRLRDIAQHVGEDQPVPRGKLLDAKILAKTRMVSIRSQHTWPKALERMSSFV